MKNETNINILYFIKFGMKENIIDLYENGRLYFNTIDYFQNLENEQGIRGDNYEGTTRLKNYNELDKVKLELVDPKTGKKIVLNPTKFHLREYLSDIKGNLYSLYSLKTPEILDYENYKIDQRVKGFGDYFIVIQDVNRFLNAIQNELEKLDLSYKFKLVEYYEKKELNGEITLFDKPSEFEFQQEYRIVIYNDKSKPIKINIGSLKEFSSIFNIDAIDDMKIDFVKNNID